MALWKRVRRVRAEDYLNWQSIDHTPIPLSLGRIWLADKTGNVRRAMAFTWPVLKRREPGKYSHWMKRADRSKLPPAAPAQS